MRHRFFIERFSEKGTTLALPDLVHQIGRVLKLRVGEEVVLWTGDGVEYIFAIEKISAKDVRGRVVGVEENTREPDVSVTLYCAILKRENFELVCQKATEVGISAIVPLITERTVKVNINQSRLKKIVQEAAEQSGRARIPVLCDAISFSEALKRVEKDGTNLFFDVSSQNSQEPPLVSAVLGAGEERSKAYMEIRCRVPQPSNNEMCHQRRFSQVNLFIGPEGGWTDTERVNAMKAGLQFRSLGSLTLRAETAAIVASYIAVQRMV